MLDTPHNQTAFTALNAARHAAIAEFEAATTDEAATAATARLIDAERAILAGPTWSRAHLNAKISVMRCLIADPTNLAPYDVERFDKFVADLIAWRDPLPHYAISNEEKDRRDRFALETNVAQVVWRLAALSMIVGQRLDYLTRDDWNAISLLVSDASDTAVEVRDTLYPSTSANAESVEIDD